MIVFSIVRDFAIDVHIAEHPSNTSIEIMN
jgi:hypothetical protein